MNASPTGAGSESGPERQPGPVPGSWPGDQHPRPKLQVGPHSQPTKWSPLLGGDRIWGSFDVSPGMCGISRYGVSRYRLVVFPPGVSRIGRGRLRLWRTWPMWGALIWVASAIWLSAMVSSWTAIGIATALYLSSGAAALALAGALRSQVRTLSAWVVDRRPDQRSAVKYDELATLAAILSDADVRCESGQLSETDHQAVWSRVYDRLGPGHPEPTQAQPPL